MIREEFPVLEEVALLFVCRGRVKAVRVAAEARDNSSGVN